MTLTPEETKKIKQMFRFLIKKKQEQTDGHNGFYLQELEPILDRMAQDGEIEMRPSINRNTYFLNP